MNYTLYRSLHGRGLTQAKLAELTGINRSVLARILTNEHGRGKESRPKIIPFLCWTEIRALGWEKEARQYSRQWEETTGDCSTTNIVPPVTA